MPMATRGNKTDGVGATYTKVTSTAGGLGGSKAVYSASHGVGGALSALFTESIVYPIDVVKSRMQIQTTQRGPFGVMLAALQNGGARSLYQGMSVHLVGNAVSWGSFFFLYNQFKQKMRRHNQDTAVSRLLPPTARLDASEHLLCAALAGTLTTLVSNPIWMVKTRLQLQEQSFAAGGSASQGTLYRGPVHAARLILRNEGPMAFYRGLAPALLMVSNGSIQFMVYEELRWLAVRRAGAEEGLGSHHFLAMGAGSKVTSTLVTYPLQVLRTHLYKRNDGTTSNQRGALRSLVSLGADIWKRRGILGFYQGLSAQFLKSVPASALTFFAYESLMRWLP